MTIEIEEFRPMSRCIAETVQDGNTGGITGIVRPLSNGAMMTQTSLITPIFMSWVCIECTPLTRRIDTLYKHRSHVFPSVEERLRIPISA